MESSSTGILLLHASPPSLWRFEETVGAQPLGAKAQPELTLTVPCTKSDVTANGVEVAERKRNSAGASIEALSRNYDFFKALHEDERNRSARLSQLAAAYVGL